MSASQGGGSSVGAGSAFTGAKGGLGLGLAASARVHGSSSASRGGRGGGGAGDHDRKADREADREMGMAATAPIGVSTGGGPRSEVDDMIARRKEQLRRSRAVES